MPKPSKEKLQSYILASELIKFEDGKPYWKKPRKGASQGRPCGSLDNVGYRRICVGGQMLLAHRVNWFICNKEIPEDYIDHIDGRKDNNRIENLRRCSIGENQRNMKKPITNSTGFKGVYRNTGRGRPFCAQVKFNNKKYYLGRFDTAEEAKKAYDKKAKELHNEFYRYE